MLTPTKLQVGDLKKEWHEGTPIYEYFKVNSTHLQGFEDIDKMDKEEIAAYEKYEKLKKRLEKAPQDEWDQLEAELQDATDSLKDILGRSDLVVTIANHIQYVHTFKHQSLKRLIKAGAVAALGIVAFAWAANPPPESSSVSLRGADLHGADLSGVNLRGADLTGAVLRDVDFTGTDLRGANLTGADVSGVTWSGTLCPDGVNSDDSAGSCENHLEPRGRAPPEGSVGESRPGSIRTRFVQSDPEYARRLGLALRAASFRCESVGASGTAELMARAAEMICPESADVDYDVLEAMSAYSDISVRSY